MNALESTCLMWSRTPRWRRHAVLAAMIGTSACGGSEPSAPPEAPSAIVVDVSMAGNAIDPDGFSIAVAKSTLRFAGAGTQQVTGIRRGSYVAKIAGLADNCATDSSSWTVDVSAGTIVPLNIVVECCGGFAYNASGVADSGASLYYLGEDGRTSVLATAGLQAEVNDWSSDGKRLIVEREEHDGTFTVSIMNVDSSPVRDLGSAISPRFSPDGTEVAYCTFQVPTGYRLRVADVVGTHDRQALADSAGSQDCFAAWSPDGSHLAFETNRFRAASGVSTVAVIRSDGSDLQPIGGAFDMTGPAAAWSPNGRLIAAVLSPADLAATRPELGIVPSGGEQLTLAWSGDSLVQSFTWSPDGAKLALGVVDFVRPDGGTPVVINPDGSGQLVLAPSLLSSQAPGWSADGSRILFAGVARDGTHAIYVVRPDGTHLHAIVRGRIYVHPMWQPTARPGENDRAP